MFRWAGRGVGIVQDELLSMSQTVPGWLGGRVGWWVSPLGWEQVGIVLDNCCGCPGWVGGTLHGPSNGW